MDVTLLEDNAPLIWFIIGILLFICEILSGDGALISLGVSGLALSVFLKLTNWDIGILWQLVCFSAVGVVVSIFVRRFLRRTAQYSGDINTFQSDQDKS
jgi:membrane protein implicated in regulation of membrane protease activity